VRLVLLLSDNKYSKDNCPFELVKLKEELLSDIFLHSTLDFYPATTMPCKEKLKVPVNQQK
jgi:hypothetical protein